MGKMEKWKILLLESVPASVEEIPPDQWCRAVLPDSHILDPIRVDLGPSDFSGTILWAEA